MVRPHDEPGPLDVRTQHKKDSNDREALFLRRSDKIPVHVSHAQEALELRLVTRGKRLRQALDVLLVHLKLTWTDDMSQVVRPARTRGESNVLERGNG